MKYGTGLLYGDGHLFGASVYDYPRLFWTVLIDWSGDGSFLDESNNLAKSLYIDRGRDFFINMDSTGYEPVSEGTLSITLDNSDDRYNPYNTGSPLYPNVNPGKKIYISVIDGSTGTEYACYTGTIDDIQPDTQSATVNITAVDLIKELQEQNISIPVEDAITFADAAEMVLAEAGITNYAVDNNLDSIPYWWVSDKTPFDALQEICDATLGTFFVGVDGKAKMYNRARPVSSVISLTQSEILKDIMIRQPWEVVRNAVDVKINTLTEQSSGVIWTMTDKPYVPAGTSLEVWGDYSYSNESCPAINVLNPVATTDYTMNTQANGTGTNKTSFFTVTKEDFGGSVKVTITNTGGVGAYVTLCQIKGQAITTPDPSTIKRTDPVSIALYKTRKFVIDNPWLQATSTGESLATVIIDLHANGRKFPMVKIQARPELQFAVDLFDRINLDVAKLGISDAYRVGKIKHEWLHENGQDVITTLHLEPVVNVAPSTGSTFPWTFTVTLS